MSLSSEAAVGGREIVVSTARVNPLYGHDAPLIRVTSTGGSPDPVSAAIARQLRESGSVYLELPDGRLAVVLDLDCWIPQTCEEGSRG